VLTPPEGLTTELLGSALADGWGFVLESAEYLPLGFGSHHWRAADAAGTVRFVTVDELAARRWSEREPLDSVAGRLGAALATAVELAGHGLSFVAAPIPARSGEPLVRLTERFTVALYPYLTGRTFGWGEFMPGQREAVLGLVVALHTAPVAAARGRARADELTISFRDALEAALGAGAPPAGACPGPYGRPAAELIASHRAGLHRALERYDALASRVRLTAGSVPAVLTHGEPHPGNTMLTPDGWLLIDWDTALIAPPERDLCLLDPGDGSVFAAYAAATGVQPRPEAAELFRLRWDLSDIAIAAAEFRGPHTGNANEAKAFAGLGPLLARLAG